MAMVALRFEVHLVRLDPTEGREIKKTRPCLVVSPDEMNQHLSTGIVAPMTTKGRDYPTRVPVVFRKRRGQVAPDQLRAVDRACLICRLGRIDEVAALRTLTVLARILAR